MTESSATSATATTRTPRISALGFGCAGLYRLSTRRDRRAVLEAAYDIGIRHFDVAPMYGLGVAEAELRGFVSTHPGVRIATKYGIAPTWFGRMAGSAPRVISCGLQRNSSSKATSKSSDTAHASGVLGRVLYTSQDLSLANARRSLRASLRRLGIEHIDYFFVHEPVGHFAYGAAELADYLDRERQRGVIGRWGPAGDLTGMNRELSQLTRRASAVQYPYDLAGNHVSLRASATRTAITFGLITTAVPIVERLFRKNPLLLRVCALLLDRDPADRTTIISMLMRDALANNPFGIVLISSTSVAHVHAAATWVGDPLPGEDRVMALIRREYRRVGP